MAWTSWEGDMAWTSWEQGDDHGHCYGHWEEQSHANSEAQLWKRITDPKKKGPRSKGPASVSGRDDTSGDGSRHSRGSTLPRSSIA